MVVTCPNCHEQLEVEMELQVGQHVFCPFCSTKFSYGGMGRGHTKLLTRPWGRNQVLGFVLGLFLGVFGMLIAVLIDKHKYLRGALYGLLANFILGMVVGMTVAFYFTAMLRDINNRNEALSSRLSEYNMRESEGSVEDYNID